MSHRRLAPMLAAVSLAALLAIAWWALGWVGEPDPTALGGAPASSVTAPQSTPMPGEAATAGRTAVPARGPDEAPAAQGVSARTVRVLVRDDAGRPVAGVPVSLRENATAPAPGGALAASTGPDGIAAFHRARFVLPAAWGGRCTAVLDVALAEPVHAAVDLAELPALLELRLPSTGALRVRLVTDTGPLVVLGQEPTAQLFTGVATGTAGERELRVVFTGASLLLPRLGLGLRCRLVMDGAECQGAIEFAGPTTPGEETALDFPVTPMPVLTGRIVDRQHLPRAGAWVLEQIQDTPGWLQQEFATGADGRFRFRLAAPPLPGEQSGLLVRTAAAGDDEQAFAVVARELLHGGQNDVGDLVLGPPPVLVAGRVVDQRGVGIAGARLRVLRTRGDDSWGLSAVSRQDPHTGSDGAFAIRAHALPHELRLLAFHGARAGGELPFLPPARHVVYPLPAVGGLAMALRCVGGLRPTDLWFQLRAHASGEWLGCAARHVLADGMLHWRGLLPGRYRLVITTAGATTPLWQHDDVTIAADATTTLPDLTLGEGLRALTLRVQDHGGTPVAEACVVLDPDVATGPRTALRSPDGVFHLLLPRIPVAALVTAPGRRLLRIPDLRADRVVMLEPGLVVDLHARVTPAPRADQRLVPRLQRASAAAGDEAWLRLDRHLETYAAGRDERLWRQDVPLDRDLRARLLVPEPGEYEIRWWLDAYRDFAPLAVPSYRFTVGADVAVTRIEATVALPAQR